MRFGCFPLSCLCSVTSSSSSSYAQALPWHNSWFHSNAFFYFADLSICFPKSLPLLSANSVPSTASVMRQAPFLGLSLLVSHCIAPETPAKCFLWQAVATATLKWQIIQLCTAWLLCFTSPGEQGRQSIKYYTAHARHWHLLTPQKSSTCLLQP